jgi:hypothetical protein
MNKRLCILLISLFCIVAIPSSDNAKIKRQTLVDTNGKYTFTGIEEGIDDLSALLKGTSNQYKASVSQRKLSKVKSDDAEDLTLPRRLPVPSSSASVKQIFPFLALGTCRGILL